MKGSNNTQVPTTPKINDVLIKENLSRGNLLSGERTNRLDQHKLYKLAPKK